MKKIVTLFCISLCIVSCTFIENLQKANETAGKIELRYYKKNAINYTELALKSLRNYNELKATDEEQFDEVSDSIDKAIDYVNKYGVYAKGFKSDNLSAKKALGYVKNAKSNFEGNFKESAEVCLRLAVKYMLNDKIALWQYQERVKHIFPDYLKWGTEPDEEIKTVEHPDTLVFSGGGAKGVAYAGVAKYFQEKNKLDGVNRYIGVSAGSIICSFMSVGQYYEKNKKPDDPSFSELVFTIVKDTDLFAFVDNPVLRYIIENNNYDLLREKPLATMPPLAEALDTQYALCSGDTITEFFEKSLERLGLKKDITLYEHYEKTGKHLVLVSCSLSYRRTAYFDYETAPEMKLVDAIRASMAVPYVFKPIKYNNDFFIDGGLATNYPIGYFNFYSTEKGKTPKVLGFILFSEEEMFKPKWEVVNDPLKYALAIIKTVMINSGRSLFEKNIDKTICIDCGEIDIMSFNMSQDQKDWLMEAGYKAVERYFNKGRK